ncbi:MAG: cation:proton antiporter [Cyanobacteria bacterium J06649_4]
MLVSLLWMLLGGLLAGQVAMRLKAPALLGMVVIGIALGPQGGDVLSPGLLSAADDLRTIAVMVILMKAGLGLDREKLMQQGSVVLRLGWLPALCEAIAVAAAAMWLFQFDWLTGLLLGCIVGAESPAVIVPGMLRLKQLGWGVKKGIPDAILMGSALSDVLLLLLFSLLLAFLSQETVAGFTLPGGWVLSPLQLLPFQVVLQVILGLGLGWLAARFSVLMLARQRWTQTVIQKTLAAAGLASVLVVFAQAVPVFSGYLAVMAMGFFIIEFDAPLARQLRSGFNGLWAIAQIILFVLLGASIQLSVLEESLLLGLLLLAIGTLVGRSLGWYLSTVGSNWTWRERLFLLPGNSAKATVQAAIGAIPLAQGIEGGEVILAIAALSILVTAPLGAWAIPTFAPKLLERGVVDATKVAIASKTILLAAVDASPTAIQVLTKAAELARLSDGEVVVLHVQQFKDSASLAYLHQQSQRCLADIRYRFETVLGNSGEEIVAAVNTYNATEIVIAKRSGGFASEKGDEYFMGSASTGSVARAVVEASPCPVIIVTS